MQEITPLDPPSIRVTFADRDQAIEALCLKVFGAKPQYAPTQPKAPEPLEVKVWVHENGNLLMNPFCFPNVMPQMGYKLRRATIHPEEVKP
jgi:hypothetical protein